MSSWTDRLRGRTRRYEHSRRAAYDALTPIAPRERADLYSHDGTRLHVEVFGPEHAPTIVLAHGWTCSIVFWTRQIRELSKDYRVVAYDQRGHGGSGSPGPAGATTTALADDLATVLSSATPPGEKVILAGHSMGGMSMIALAQRHPAVLQQKVAAGLLASTGMSELVVRSTIVPLPMPLATTFAPLSAWVMGVTPPGSALTPSAKALTKYVSLSASASPAEVDFCSRVIAACSPATRRGFARLLAHLDLDAAIPQFDVPVTVVAGVRDRLTPIWHARRMAASLPQLRELIEIEDAGHMTPVQSGDRVNAAIADLMETYRTRIDLRPDARPAPAPAAEGAREPRGQEIS